MRTPHTMPLRSRSLWLIKTILEKKGLNAAVLERSYLDKVRLRRIKRPTGPDIRNVWEIIRTTYADLLALRLGRVSITSNDYDQKLARSEIDAKILMELDRAQPVRDW